MGPGAGRDGGRVIAEGTPEQITRNKVSVTGPYLG
jgi:excinuclease ABC subunit A